MQHKTAAQTRHPFVSIDGIFQSPARYAQQLQTEHLITWGKSLCLAFAGYTIFGLSIALAPHASASITAVWSIPLIFILAQLVSLPALYIFHAFFGSRLSPQQVAATGMISLLVPALLLAGLAPINWFMLASVKHPEQLIWLQTCAMLGAAMLGYMELLNTLPAMEHPVPPQPTNQIAAKARQSKVKYPSSPDARKRQKLLLVWFMLYLGVLYKLMKWLT